MTLWKMEQCSSPEGSDAESRVQSLTDSGVVKDQGEKPPAEPNDAVTSSKKQWDALREEGEELCVVTDLPSYLNAHDRHVSEQEQAFLPESLSKQIASTPKNTNGTLLTAHAGAQGSSEQRKKQDFVEVVDQIHPSSDEIAQLLKHESKVYVVDPAGELFQSIPGLVYTRLNEDGNIVGSESNLFHADPRYLDEEKPDEMREATGQIDEEDTLAPNVLHSTNARTSDVSQPVIAEIYAASAITQSHGASSEGSGMSRLSRAWSTSQVSRRGGSYNPRRLGGRQSRYTWYRSQPKKKFLKRTMSLDERSVTSFSLWSTSRREKAMLFCFALLNLSSMMCISLFAPFFPQEAEWKGVSTAVVGWIFGSYSLAQLFFSPLFGIMLRWVDAKFMFCWGMFFGGSCFALFGCVAYIPSKSGQAVIYVLYCFLLRVSASLGCTAASTASFALTASEFTDHATTVFGLLETFCGIGLSIGPAIGGALYDLGGFVLPFFVLGGVMILAVPVSLCLLSTSIRDESEEGSTHSMLELLRIPAVLITCFCIAMGAMVWAMLDPLLQPHLAQFHVSASTVGLFFLLMCSLYAICSPLWGKICDRINDSSPMMLLGLILSGVGLLLLGPSTLIGFPASYNELWLNIVALVVLGIAVSLAVIPSFDKMLDAAEKAGLEENLELYGLIAGLWGSVYALGDFSGPVLGGFLTEKFGFKSCVTYVAIACGVVALFVLFLWIWEMRNGPTQLIGAKKPRITGIQSEEWTNERRPLLEEC